MHLVAQPVDIAKQGDEEINGFIVARQGCCKVTIALRNQTRKRYIEMIRKLASGMSHICFPLSCKESDRNIVEHGEHFWRMLHVYLSMILTKGHIASMMEAIFNPPMASGQLKELLRSRYMLWETGHSVTNLCGGDPHVNVKGIVVHPHIDIGGEIKN
jgi:hypothetical protein